MVVADDKQVVVIYDAQARS
ncbi:uncharacterized protein G2W53_027977 [Senna tora]|uniref:Uncharacterized protein n=1 Tax=Senna tora TaxID=362788 RepID=A0A834WA35_9FABA|nr:uncharacterized protein G2W53_027977 [Senna tora]